MALSSFATVPRIGRHHFAHLRAVASGISIQDAALRYLGIDNRQQAKLAHYQTIDAVKAIARRKELKTWRLVGLAIPVQKISAKESSSFAVPRPSLEEFITSRDLDGWSEQEVVDMYEEAHPAIDGSTNTATALGFPERKFQRREKLRLAQVELLSNLEEMSAEAAQTTDKLSGWFDLAVSEKLEEGGIFTLADLRERIDVSRSWHSKLAGIGKTKAERIERHLELLIPPSAKNRLEFNSCPSDRVAERAPSLGFLELGVPPPPSPSLSNNDLMELWLSSKANSDATQKSYRREILRLLLWLKIERSNIPLSQVGRSDCEDYVRFLQNIPKHWIVRKNVAPLQPGWLPFRGQLTSASCKQAGVILSSAFHWLSCSGHISSNPWSTACVKVPSEKLALTLSTHPQREEPRALSAEDWRAINGYIASKPPSPSRARIEFIFAFVAAAGARPAELVRARLRDISYASQSLDTRMIRLQSTGAKARIIPLSSAAFSALTGYLAHRGLTDIACADLNLPLLSSLKDSRQSVGYQALHEHVKSWLTRAAHAQGLSAEQSIRLRSASSNWLRGSGKDTGNLT